MHGEAFFGFTKFFTFTRELVNYKELSLFLCWQYPLLHHAAIGIPLNRVN
jgi:hypothetical protein